MKITKPEVTVEVTNHTSALLKAQSFIPRPTEIPIEQVIQRIIKLNDGLRKFWGEVEGWAPLEAAHLLSRSRLDWQVSLSHCLRMWAEEPTLENRDGYLILGWANLGSLVEGTMKLFLSVWYETYRNDEDCAIMRRGELQDPDGLQLEPMRQYFRKRIWDDVWDRWIQHIQHRRNAIHAYKDREIGTHSELLNAIQRYLEFLRYINIRLPYPDEVYVPQEADTLMTSEVKIIVRAEGAT